MVAVHDRSTGVSPVLATFKHRSPRLPRFECNQHEPRRSHYTTSGGNVTNSKWDIRREGHAWDGESGEAIHKLNMFPARAEMDGGMLFWNEQERLTALALLLENVGVDQAVRLGNPDVWRQAVATL
jgi:hypothetical protein